MRPFSKRPQPISRNEKIEFVLDREFPNILFDDLEAIERRIARGLTVDQASQKLVDEYDGAEALLPQEIEMALARLDQLRQTEDHDLDVLYKEEKSRKRQEEKAEAAARDEQLFNKPDAAADFEYWCQHEYWTVEEAAALMLGKKPGIVEAVSLSMVHGRSPFVSRYSRLLWLIRQALEAGKVGDEPHVDPRLLLSWARQKRINVPPELEFQVRAHNIEEPDWQAQCEQLRRENEQLRQKLAEQSRELDVLRPAEQSLEPKSLKSLLSLILGMAILRFEYQTDKRSSTAKIIQGELEDLRPECDLNLTVKDDTVHTWLRRAADELEVNWANTNRR